MDTADKPVLFFYSFTSIRLSWRIECKNADENGNKQRFQPPMQLFYYTDFKGLNVNKGKEFQSRVLQTLSV